MRTFCNSSCFANVSCHPTFLSGRRIGRQTNLEWVSGTITCVHILNEYMKWNRFSQMESPLISLQAEISSSLVTQESSRFPAGRVQALDFQICITFSLLQKPMKFQWKYNVCGQKMQKCTSWPWPQGVSCMANAVAAAITALGTSVPSGGGWLG